MADSRCLYCYQSITNGDFHPACSRKFFGTPEPPELPFRLDEVQMLAGHVIRSSISLTGVQAKLSLDFDANRDLGKKKRLTIVGMWGRFILKPPTEEYASLPEVEDLTMHIAETLKIRTVPHSLIRMKSGELAYISRRVDRIDGQRLHMEDMCQLTERLTEDKYKGSIEQIGKAVKRHSDNGGFDLVELFRIVLVSFLTGNADMHLKNFSLLQGADGSFSLSPASDLVATKIVMPEDPEESALTINGKKRNLRESDFKALANSLEISEVVYRNVMREFAALMPKAEEHLTGGFLHESMRRPLKELIKERSIRLGLK